MKPLHHRLAIAGMLATLGLTALAQTNTPPTGEPKGPPPREHRMHRPDPAKMEAFMAKRQAALKEKLHITPAQEGAWTAFTTAMKPPAQPPVRPDQAEFAKLTTPERIDRMRARQAEHQAAMDKRLDAVKTFYAALTPEQQKVFDAQHPPGFHGREHGEGMRPGSKP